MDSSNIKYCSWNGWACYYRLLDFTVKAKLASQKTNFRQSKTSLPWDSQFQLQQEKSLEVVAPDLTTRKKLKSRDFSWTHQKTEVAGQTTTMKSGETSKCRESRVKIS